jgi:hypothetical protein
VSATGVRQGDPLAGLFFCLGIHDTLLKIRDYMTESSIGTIFAYSDETNVACSSSRLEDVCGCIIK